MPKIIIIVPIIGTIMVVQEAKQMKIEIPLSGLDELAQYQKSLLGVLRTIKVGQCNSQMQDNIKTVYALLSHMLIDNKTSVNHLNDDRKTEPIG